MDPALPAALVPTVVAELQRVLGVYPDGVFGPLTRDSLKQLQKKGASNRPARPTKNFSHSCSEPTGRSCSQTMPISRPP